MCGEAGREGRPRVAQGRVACDGHRTQASSALVLPHGAPKTHGGAKCEAEREARVRDEWPGYCSALVRTVP